MPTNLMVMLVVIALYTPPQHANCTHMQYARNAPFYSPHCHPIRLQVVAPVRETAAQVLGAAVTVLPPPDVALVLSHLLALWAAPHWQTRMAALTAAKYLVAAREDMATALAATLLPTALQGLQVGVECRLSCSDEVSACIRMWAACLPAQWLVTEHIFPPCR